jgi:hypothetical protein
MKSKKPPHITITQRRKSDITIHEVEKYHKAILENAKHWANGKGSPLYQEDIIVISDYLDMNIPATFHKFISSNDPGTFNASGGYKTIRKTLDRIQKKILNGLLDKFINGSEPD